MSKQTEDALTKGMERPVPHQGNSGEKTEDLKELDTAALEDPKLLTSVEERLANLGEMTRPSRPGRNDPEIEDEEEIADEPPAKEEDSGKSKESSDSTTLDEDKPGLPEAYVRAAVGYGWKREEVLEQFESNPELTLKTLSNLYQTRNRASAEFAAIGRRHMEQSKEEKQAPQFPPVDVAKLKEQYGDDAGPLIEMLEAQNKVLNQLVPRLVEKRQDRVFDSAVEESGVEQQIHRFFEADSLKPYEKVYGKLEFGMTWYDLTPGQREMRERLLVTADQIAGGARNQAVDMKLEEALEMAHSLVTQKYRDQVLIDGIKAKVVQRSKAISVKPSEGARKPDKGEEPKPGNRSKEQLEKDTQKKLTKLFGG